MPKWNGGVIGVANNPTQSSAKGIWSLSEATKAIRAGLWPPSNAGADPYFENVTLLLPGDGTNGAQNNTFLDSSTNNFTITRNGNTTQGTFTPFSKPDGRWGLRTNDRSYLTIPASGDFDLISTDFTVEFWFNLNTFNTMSGSGNNFFGNGLATATNGWAISFDGSGTTATSVTFGVWNGGSFSSNVFSGLTLNMGTWYHIVLQRNGTGAGNLRLFVNGVLQGSAVNSVTYSTAGSTFTFGSGAYTQNATYSGNADYFISNVRLTKAPVYSTSGFTSPTSNLSQISGTTLLICQSNRLINNGTNAGAITSTTHSSTIAQVVPFSPFPTLTAYAAGTNGGSGYFDGTGDYLTVSDSNLAPGTGDFTIEMWVYATVTPTDDGIFESRSNGTGTAGFTIGAFDGTTIRIYSGSALITASSISYVNTWCHVAVVKASGTTTLYINGVSKGTTTSIGNQTDTSWAIGGGRYSGTTTPDAVFSGYISGFRYVKGTAVYTTNFTPPTSPPTAITNTSLLLNYTNGGIIDTSMSNDLETAGGAQISTTQSKWGGASISFDGTGDALVAPSSVNFTYGTGNFTIEGWHYLTASASSTKYIFDHRTAQGLFPAMYIDAGSYVVYINSAIALTAGTVTANAWVHFALVKNGSTTTLYINGTSAGSFTDNNNYSSTARLRIGTEYTASGSYDWQGYIDDFRITKGYARYTANFTAPSGPFIGFGD